ESLGRRGESNRRVIDRDESIADRGWHLHVDAGYEQHHHARRERHGGALLSGYECDDDRHRWRDKRDHDGRRRCRYDHEWRRADDLAEYPRRRWLCTEWRGHRHDEWCADLA